LVHGELMAVKNHKYTPLDPDKLLTLFTVKTNWHVITGAACCGKTTTIDLLAERGGQIAAETARTVENVVFSGNLAAVGGGGLHNY